MAGLIQYDPLISAIARDCTRSKPLKAALDKLHDAGGSITIVQDLTAHLTDEALEIYYDHKAEQMAKMNQWLPRQEAGKAERGAC